MAKTKTAERTVENLPMMQQLGKISVPEGRVAFDFQSHYQPAGDQPKAIKELVDGFKAGKTKQTLLGVTGSGKTFTMANVVQALGKKTLVMAHNKTLAAQLYSEFKEFFPHNAVEYFVSYYDYYQPEAYVAGSDTFIEKDAMINEEIDRLRHASTQALLTRKDVIIIASVSCIYGLGSPKEYERENIHLKIGEKYTKVDIMKRLVAIHYERTNADLSPGQFRAVGNRVDVMPVSETVMLSIDFSGGTISSLAVIDPVSMRLLENVQDYFIFPAKHFISDEPTRDRAVKTIQAELKLQLKKFEEEGKLLE